jgi:hypothetical protein
LLRKIRKNYPGVKILCWATPVPPHFVFRNYLKKIIEKQQKKYNNIYYHEFATENLGLNRHPNVTEHEFIAKGIRDKIKEITKWYN